MKRTLIVLCGIFGIFGVLALTLLFSYLGVTAGVRLDPDKLTLDTACIRIYDAEGGRMETAKRTGVASGALPAHLTGAFVAVEDKRFYEHGGLDYLRIGKAMLKNAASFSFREGASTISQQLIKNTHLSGEKTIARKLREIKLTRELERRYSKEEILTLYLNSIYFGHDAFGIANAAKFYFGKDAEELVPAESAMLAALVKAPNTYSPFKNAEKCLGRRNFVLKLMAEQGIITNAEYAEACRTPLPVSPVRTTDSAYLSRVFEELAEIFPLARAGELGALKVYTYEDPNLQKKLEEQETDSDFCALVTDNRTHGIRALRSTCGTPKRLPASVIKPLLVYGPAIEENLISPATPLSDERADFGGYCPDDAGGASGTYVSARYALSRSVNIPAVRVLNELGCERALSYLEKMGLCVGKEDETLALALGGMKEGFTLPALADGYTTLANGGMYAPSHAVARVESDSGKLLWRHSPMPAPVFSKDTAYLVSDMLKTAAAEGTARRLNVLPFEVCAKTGTAEGKGGNTDAYTIAYTAEDTVAVWLGNRDNSPMTGVTGGGLPANIALSIFREMYHRGAPAPFPACESMGVERIAYDKAAYLKDHRILRADPLSPEKETLSELFRASFVPQDLCTRYSHPSIGKPQISVQNGAVKIVLCHAEYYDYVVKRENRGQTTTIYSGRFREIICDNSVRAGESYTYTVTPYFKEQAGEPILLPTVHIKADGALPDDWWLS